MNTFKWALAATGIATTVLYMKKRARQSSLGDPGHVARSDAATNPQTDRTGAESLNQGERLQAQHFQGAGNGTPFGMSGGSANSTHDDLLSPGSSKRTKTRSEDADADITPGLPDFSRGA
ncbi:MAG: hypothetical protein V4739_11370 [Pseudomonadota bacterium]